MTSAGASGLVTIVVASYNHAAFLPQRMESLLAQTYPALEILVIDDRSPDNSVEVLSRYAAHPRVTLLVREQNGGWVAVSNQGVAMARGEFVLFANCDDACEPTMVARLVAGMALAPGAGISFCRSLLVDEANNVLGDDFGVRDDAFRRRCATDTLLSGAEMHRFLFDSCVIPNLSAALIRRECFATAGLLSDSYRVCCDWDLFFRIVARYDAYYVADPLNHFRQHASTIRSRTKERVVYAEYLRLLLPQVHAKGMSPRDRAEAREKVMSIWALHLIAPSWAGLRNLRYHLSIVRRHDPVALWYLPGALARRAATVVGKAFSGRAPAASRA